MKNICGVLDIKNTAKIIQIYQNKNRNTLYYLLLHVEVSPIKDKSHLVIWASLILVSGLTG